MLRLRPCRALSPRFEGEDVTRSVTDEGESSEARRGREKQRRKYYAPSSGRFATTFSRTREKGGAPSPVYGRGLG
jgi:hypothetical protein